MVITLAAVYAQEAMRFTTWQTMALIFVVNVASAAGAFAFGYAQDRIGARAALAATLNAVDAEVVVSATPCDLAALLPVNKPVVRARYEFVDLDAPALADWVRSFLSERGMVPLVRG